MSKSNNWRIFRMGRQLRVLTFATLFWTIALTECLAADAIVARGPGTEYAPVVTANGAARQFLVTWFDVSPSPLNSEQAYFRVFGRRVNAQGKPVGSAFLISRNGNTDPTLGGGHPAIAYNPDRREFLVVYDRSYDGSSSKGIFAQRVSASGVLLGNELPIYAGDGQQSPRVVYDSVNHRYFVVWTGNRGVLGLMLSDLGAPIGRGGFFGPTGAGSLALAFNPGSRRYLLAYTLGDAATSDVWALVLDKDAQLVALPAVSTAAGEQSLPAVTANTATNQFLVVWTDARDPLVAPKTYGQLLDGNGNLVGSNVVLADAALFSKVDYAAATNRYLLTWQLNDLNSRKHMFIFGRPFLPDLSPEGPFFVVSTNAAVGRASVAVVPSTANAFAVWAGLAPGKKSAILGKFTAVSPPGANLTLSVIAASDPARVGDTVTYGLRIANSGTLPARSIILSNELPGRLRALGATSSQGNCKLLNDRLVRCALGTLARRAQASVTITAEAMSSGVTVNNASVSWLSRGAAAGPTSAQVSARITN